MSHTSRARRFPFAHIRIIWVLLVLLAAFVIFIQCVAEIGGSAEPVPHPNPTFSPIVEP